MKFGRKPARHTLRTARSMLVMYGHLSALGPPPAQSTDYISAVNAATGSSWGMDGNDTVGDCICADTAHEIMLRSAKSGSIIVPTAQQTLDLYSALTGYNPADPSTDQGADETSMCEYMINTGWLGVQSLATGMIDPTNFDHIKWGIELFGGVRVGWNLPQSAMDQFSAGQPWVDIGDTNIVGGHDTCLVGYASSHFYTVTWGKLQLVDPNFLNPRYLEEAHGEVWKDWAYPGDTLEQLVADLPAVA